MSQQRLLVLHEKDNVAVALTSLQPGETVQVSGSPHCASVAVRQPIGQGHKIALCALATGDTVIKYGQPIGVVTQPVAAGEHVHIHNVASSRAG